MTDWVVTLVRISLALYAAAVAIHAPTLVGSMRAWREGLRRAGEAALASAAVAAAAAWLIRWVLIGRLPLQSMFEVFVFMGMALYPISLFCRRVLGARLPLADALLGLVILVPAGFIFPSAGQPLPPALRHWLFGWHVSVYLLAYVILLIAAAHAVTVLAMLSAGHLVRRVESLSGGGAALPARSASLDELAGQYDRVIGRLVHLGFPPLTLGLALGSYWGKLAWGDFWFWDPKELWGLITWLFFVAYFHHRRMTGGRRVTWNALWVALGGLAILITLVVVNLMRVFAGRHSYA